MGVEVDKGHNQHRRRAEENGYRQTVQAFEVIVCFPEGFLILAHQQVSEDGIDARGHHFQHAPQAHRHHVIHAVDAQSACVARDHRAQNHARALLKHIGQFKPQRIPAFAQRSPVGNRLGIDLRIVLLHIAAQKHRAQHNRQRSRKAHHNDVHSQIGQHHQQRCGQHERRHAGQRHHIGALICCQQHTVARHGEEFQRAAHAHGHNQRHHAQMAHLQALHIHDRHKHRIDDGERQRYRQKHPACRIVKAARRGYHAADSSMILLGQRLVQRRLRRSSQTAFHHFKIGQEFRNRYDQSVDLRPVVEDHQSGGDKAHHHRCDLIHGGGQSVLHKACGAAGAQWKDSFASRRNKGFPDWKNSIRALVCQCIPQNVKICS